MFDSNEGIASRTDADQFIQLDRASVGVSMITSCFLTTIIVPPSLVPPLQCDNMLAVMAIVLVETDLFGYVAVLNLLPLDLETT